MVAKYIWLSPYLDFAVRSNHLYSFFSYESTTKHLILLLEQQFTGGSRKEKSVVVIESVPCG
jgi:hypothetical protein